MKAKKTIVLGLLVLLTATAAIAQTPSDSLIGRYRSVEGVRVMPMGKELMGIVQEMVGEDNGEKARADSMGKAFENIDSLTTVMFVEAKQEVRDSFAAAVGRLPRHGYQLLAHQKDSTQRVDVWQYALTRRGVIREFLFLSRVGDVLNFVQVKTHMTLSEFEQMLLRRKRNAA